MPVKNATCFSILGAVCAFLSGLMWWDVTRAAASGEIHDGKYGPYVTRVINPARFQNVYYNHYGIAVIFSIAAAVFAVSALVSFARRR